MFAVEHAGVEPDLITIAKSLAGGFPLSGVIGRAAIMDSVAPGGLGGTFAGSPVSCAAALAVLDVFRDEHVLARAEKQGVLVRARLEAMREQFPFIGDVRGLGAMLAIELVRDRASQGAGARTGEPPREARVGARPDPADRGNLRQRHPNPRAADRVPRIDGRRHDNSGALARRPPLALGT